MILPPWKVRAWRFTADLLKDPADIDAEPSRRERKKITQWYYRADSMDPNWRC